MQGYTKLFETIVASTIWQADDKTRIVWITMLALKNKEHVVEASLPGLANIARVTLAEVERAIKLLSEPDIYSRSKEFGGRRIEEVEGGWRILNGQAYQDKMRTVNRREYMRLKKREQRERESARRSKFKTFEEKTDESQSSQSH